MKYEGRPADKKADRAGAKRAGMSMKAWERSPADKAKDKKGQAKVDTKAMRKAGGPTGSAQGPSMKGMRGKR